MKRSHKITLSLLVLILFTGTLFVFYFNRVPNRNIPNGNVIVSPANGDVIHIESVESKTIHFFKNDIENILAIQEIEPPYKIVVIEMDLKDIHVQRAPIEGKVVYQEHFPGAHKNALSSPNVKQLANINEKNLIVFKNNEISVGVSQVAGLAARRIRSFVKIGDTLKKGDVYGRIILGSQVVVILPEKAILNVSTGETLIDGESIIATY